MLQKGEIVMKKFIKIMSLVLALLMVTSVLLACDNNDNNDDPSKDSVVATTDAETKAQSKLPAMNWGGVDYRVLGTDATTKVFENFEVYRAEMPEDVVGVAVWNRNSTLLDKYGLNVTGTFYAEPGNVAKVSLDSGDDLYDLIICKGWQMEPFAKEGQLVNMANLKYIDFENDCWTDYAIDQMSFGGKLYYATNKFLLADKHRLWAIWYNRELARELNVGYLEQEVFDNTWTLERVAQIAKTCAGEVDGSEGMTSGDRWGLLLSSPANWVPLAYGSGFRVSQKGVDNYPVMIGATDEMLDIVDRVFEITTDMSTCFMQYLRPTENENSAQTSEIWLAGRGVLYTHCISFSSNLYMATFEYGVLPMPKYTEEQQDYFCFPDTGNGCLFAVPATVNDIEKAGFGLQAISEESVDTTYREYIDTKCKFQLAYDADMAKCFELIFDSYVYDVGFVNNYGEIGDKLLWKMMQEEQQNTYARLWGSNEKRAKVQIKRLKEAYEALPY